MAAVTSVVQPAPPNRRRRVRHRIQTPAYASFTGESRSATLDLHEILNISEGGAAIQCSEPLEVGRRVNVCLDLAECRDHIYTAGQVIWTSDSGRTGLRFTDLPPLSLFRLREWLFLNAMAAVANADEAALAAPLPQEHVAPRPSYTDTLAAVTAIRREVEGLGADLAGVLRLVAGRAQTLIHASGAAIALADRDPQFMICRASSGPDAPPVGARLQVGSGFSGECVQTGKLLRCDDAESDERVDRESCSALGIRSVLAVPLRVGEKSIGILEAFSARPNAFGEGEDRAMQRLAETLLSAVNRAARAENLPQLEPAPVTPLRFAATPGSVLFASEVVEDKKEKSARATSVGGISLPRAVLYTLICALATVAMALGYLSAPWIQGDLVPWVKGKLHARGSTHLQTVLASSPVSRAENSPSGPTVETATLEQLRQMAAKGDAAAQNALGLRYATGDGVKPDEREAVNWFTRAANQGYIAAQSKLGSVYFRGRNIPQNLGQAYFWMVLARASGDENSKVLAPLVAARLTREQITSIELDASHWLQQRTANAKPYAGH
jgi:TPR repeat protein